MVGAITLDDLTLGYDRHPAVHHVTGTFSDGSLTAVVGPNGAGKSTLMKGIVGALKPIGGRIDVAGVGRRHMAYLPQQIQIDPSFPISVLDCVCLGSWNRVGAFGGIGKDEVMEARSALAVVGLDGFEGRAVGTLSRGQLQRVLFARLLVQDASIILLDEPFTAIDERTCCDLLVLVKRWHAENRTVVAVLHDFEQVRENFPETLLLARETLAWGDTCQVMTEGNLIRARAMAEAWDEAAPVCDAGDMA